MKFSDERSKKYFLYNFSLLKNFFLQEIIGRFKSSKSAVVNAEHFSSFALLEHQVNKSTATFLASAAIWDFILNELSSKMFLMAAINKSRTSLSSTRVQKHIIIDCYVNDNFTFSFSICCTVFSPFHQRFHPKLACDRRLYTAPMATLVSRQKKVYFVFYELVCQW